MNSLTIAFITSRNDPKSIWFYDSLFRQLDDYRPEIIVVNSNHSKDRYPLLQGYTGAIRNVLPKPTIWQGQNRITREDWWAKSNALNTAICLCRTEWIAFVDDRSVLAPGWLDCIEEAMRGQYAVIGYYEKRANMRVENGEIVDPGTLLGADTRTPGTYPFDSWYGGHGALPLEWCLRVQGFPEVADSLGSEDSLFGILLRNFGFPVYYDSRMRLIEDRTPGEIGGALRRSDWGESPRDASHALVEMFRDKTTSQNEFDIRNMRDRVLNGESFPPPTSSPIHWFSGEPISEKFV